MRHTNRHIPLSFALILMLLLVLLSTGCQNEIASEEESVLVETRTLQLESKAEEITYLGFVEPSQLKKYSFLVGGELKDKLVDIGDYVYPGDPLMLLDETKYQLNESAGSAQLSLASLDSQKAEEAFNYAADLYADLESLYQQGAISKSRYDEGKLNYEIAKKEYEQSKRAYSQALASLRLAQDTLDDALLISDIEGTVGGIFFEKGELVSPGYPAVIVHSKQMEIRIGVSVDDVPYFLKGQSVQVELSDELTEGIILEVASLPDSVTRTYEVKVNLTSQGLPGQNATVVQSKGSVSGIWLDIHEIRNDGEDYVYVVNEGRALRKSISLHQINGRTVRAEGLNEGEQLITKGNNLVTNGTLVMLSKEGDSLE